MLHNNKVIHQRQTQLAKIMDQPHSQTRVETSKKIFEHADQRQPHISMETSRDAIKNIPQRHPQLGMKLPQEEAQTNNAADNKLISCMGGFLRFMQLCLAGTAVGLYGLDLRSSAHAKVEANPWWIYAIAVASTSVFTVLIYSTLVRTRTFWFWDWLLFMMWVVVFGRFATLSLRYWAPTVDKISSEIPKWSDPLRMYIVVWLDLANMCLWLVTGSCETLMCILRGEICANGNCAV